MSSTLTGREPRLVGQKPTGLQRLSLRRLGGLLTVLTPSGISPDAAGAMLESNDFFVRHHAARVLAERGDSESRAVIQAAQANGSAPARASVTRHLHRLSWYSAEPLIRQGLADSDERVREAAVYALCDLRHLPAYDLLVEILPHESDSVLAAAAWGLRQCPDSAAVPVLAAVLRAEDPEVRCKALEALSANNTPDAVPVVTAALDDSEPDVVYNAVLSWIELRKEHCLSDLAALMMHTNGPRLEAMLRGLFHANNYLHVEMAALPVADTLIDTLAHAVSAEFIPARMAAVWSLAAMHHPRATQILKEAYVREPENEVRVHILRVAGSLMTFTPDEALVRAAAQSDDPALRMAAEQFAWFATYESGDVAAKPLTREELSGGTGRRKPQKKKKRG